MKEFALLFGHTRLEKVFKEIDTDNSNSIDINELQKAVTKLGHRLSRKEVETLLETVDTDSSGSVSYEEFYQFFNLVPAASLSSIIDTWVNTVHIDCGTDLSPPVASPDVPWYFGKLFNHGLMYGGKSN